MQFSQKNAKIFMHVDGDAFFASCEQATNMQWRGKPIAVGRERGIVTAISYEAKALGVRRPMSQTALSREFPQVALLASDYRKYELFSERMKSIVRRYVSDISEGSIDECFADVSSVTTWSDVRGFAKALQEELCIKLGLTISIGVGPTMTIAKIASGFKKPRGLTIVTPENLDMLNSVSLRKVPGIGGRTEQKLAEQGILTIGNLLALAPHEIERRYNKPLVELAYELRGTSVRGIEARENAQSVSSIQAFMEPIIAFAPLLTEFSRNIERVCRKLRTQHARMHAVTIGYKAFPDIHTLVTYTIKCPSPTNDPGTIMQLAEEALHAMYRKGVRYRAVYVGTHGMLESAAQQKLFTTAEDETEEKRNTLNDVVDTLMYRSGGLPLERASSLSPKQTRSEEDTGPPLLKIPHSNKILNIPYLGTIQ